MKKNTKNIILIIFLMFISLFSMPLYMKIYNNTLIDITAYEFNNIRCESLWIGFSISWVSLIFFLLLFIPSKRKIRAYLIIELLLNILFFAQICYVQQMGKFMIVSDLFVAGEGLQYIKSVFLNLNIGMIITIIFNLICVFFIIKLSKKTNIEIIKVNKIAIIFMIIIIINSRFISYISLGHDVRDKSWQENYNTKNIYNNFTNPNTAMYVSGFYEYHIRAIYKYFYNLITFDKTIVKKNVDEYNNIYGIEVSDNEYTGILKDKNVIMIMMESIDSWIIDDETMPTLKRLMETGMNFENRYSPFFNGGQTINSEFALNTGMYAISDKDTIYDIDNVDYKYSLANTLKNNGYIVNSFHANTGKFYNRKKFHSLLGYDNHYSAVDMQRLKKLNKDVNYFQDTNFIRDLYPYMINNKNKFLSFYTTYSAHLEYTKDNKVLKGLVKDTSNLNEEDIYRALAHDTDNAIKLLIESLDKDNLLDNTVLVLAADHYVYGYSDPEYVALKKEVINDRKALQNTPLIIWSKDLKHEDIEIILDTADVLPTMLNLLGINYDPNKYMGTDVFSEYHDDFVWFSDGSYIKSKDCNLSNEAILTKTNYNISKNKSILLTNYYGK